MKQNTWDNRQELGWQKTTDPVCKLREHSGQLRHCDVMSSPGSCEPIPAGTGGESETSVSLSLSHSASLSLSLSSQPTDCAFPFLMEFCYCRWDTRMNWEKLSGEVKGNISEWATEKGSCQGFIILQGSILFKWLFVKDWMQKKTIRKLHRRFKCKRDVQ